VLADGKLADGTGFEVADLAAEQGAKTLIITGYALQFLTLSGIRISSSPSGRQSWWPP
jgi:3-keto-L-gulonate-6-phosphate decarboxylase